MQTEVPVARRPERRNARGAIVPGSVINADQVAVLNRKIVWCDNATVCPTAPSRVEAAARNRRAALEIVAKEKHQDYDPHAAIQKVYFFALIIESGGAINDEWHKLYQFLSKQLDKAEQAFLKSTYRRLMVSISCLTAKGNAASLAASLNYSTVAQVNNQSNVLMAR